MLNWLISIGLMICIGGLGIYAHSKLGTVRKKDQRPHQVPWGLVMIGCVFLLFLVVVHMMNLIGVETGPEHGMFGRF